ncbi:hypothetical protein ACFX2K_019600 [Malus domestica]
MEIDTLDANNILLKLQNNVDLVDAIGGVCMVAFIFADKPPNRGASVHLLKKAWAYMGELWPKDLAFEEIPSHLIVYWVQLHGVEDPFQYLNGVWGFLHIRLQLDARKPIPTGFWLAREEEKPSRVEFYYETQRIHTLCFTCGRLELINSGCQSGPDLQPATGNNYRKRTIGTPQSGGGKATSIQSKTTVTTDGASSSNPSTLEAKNVLSSLVNAAAEAPKTELTLQLSPSYPLQQNFLFLSHPTHYFQSKNPFNTITHPRPTYQPNNSPISLLLNPHTKPTSESSSSNTSPVFKPKDGPFFPWEKTSQTLIQPIIEVGNQCSEGTASNCTQLKARGNGQRIIGNYASYAARRMVTRSQQRDQLMEVQVNMAEEITFFKET